MAGGDLTSQLTAWCEQYSHTTTQEIEKAMDDVAKEAKNKLKATSPKGNTGKYSKGWTVKKERCSGGYTIHIHNKRYQLTHLLEHGHNKRNGRGFVAARPHIAAVDTWAKEEAERKIREALNG